MKCIYIQTIKMFSFLSRRFLFCLLLDMTFINIFNRTKLVHMFLRLIRSSTNGVVATFDNILNNCLLKNSANNIYAALVYIMSPCSIPRFFFCLLCVELFLILKKLEKSILFLILWFCF